MESYDRIVDLVLDQIAVDGSITQAPGGGEAAGRSPVDRGKQGLKRSGMTDGYGIPLGRVLAGANHHESPLLAPTLDRLDDLGPLPDDITMHLDAGYDSDKTRALLSERSLRGRIVHKVRKHRSRPVSVGTSNARTPGRTPSTDWPAATNAAPSSSTPSSALPTRTSPCVAHGQPTAGTNARTANHDPTPIRASSD